MPAPSSAFALRLASMELGLPVAKSPRLLVLGLGDKSCDIWWVLAPSHA